MAGISSNQFGYMKSILNLPRDTKWDDSIGQKKGKIEQKELTIEGKPIAKETWIKLESMQKIAIDIKSAGASDKLAIVLSDPKIQQLLSENNVSPKDINDTKTTGTLSSVSTSGIQVKPEISAEDMVVILTDDIPAFGKLLNQTKK